MAPESLNSNLAAAADLNVYDARGNTIRFGDLFELDRTILIFIRHFFCGNCQQYVSQVGTVRPDALEQSGVKIVIVGCGDWQLINNYREVTSVGASPSISFYADPTRTVYRALGLTTETLQTTPKDVPMRSYMTMSRFENTARSILRAFKNPAHWGKQGNFSQLGGEFIVGPGNTCSFAHAMEHTEDHVEVAELLREAGVPYP